jgi:hypothetical protein
MYSARAIRLLSTAIAPNNRNVPGFSKEILPMYFRMLSNAKSRDNRVTNKRIITALIATKKLPSNMQRLIIGELLKSGNLSRNRVLKGPPVRARSLPTKTPKRKVFVPFWKFKSRRTVHPV